MAVRDEVLWAIKIASRNSSPQWEAIDGMWNLGMDGLIYPVFFKSREVARKAIRDRVPRPGLVVTPVRVHILIEEVN
jgi:hypothetical protein